MSFPIKRKLFSSSLLFSRLGVERVQYYVYYLKAKNQKFCREGALLRCQFKGFGIGHSDLHPYPEKAEAPLKAQLKKLKAQVPEELCSRALLWAYKEAQAKAEGHHLLSALQIPLSHYLIQDIEDFNEKKATQILNAGFKVIKVKLNTPLKAQTEKLLEWSKRLKFFVKWRVDFHFSLSEKHWQEWSDFFFAQMAPEALDFIEVPFDYAEAFWWRQSHFNSLALDVWSGENTLPVSVLVWKSSRQGGATKLLKKRAWALFRRVVFTHSLSHPLEQLISAYTAGHFYKVYPALKEVCALAQYDIYEEHDFTLPNQGPFFPKTSAPGWGLESALLDRLPWKDLEL